MTQDLYHLTLSPTQTLKLVQSTDSGTSGTTVWPGGHDLALYLTSLHTKSKLSLTAKRLIDLGTGTGIVGLTAAYHGAHVTLTDQPHVINGPILKDNIALNTPDLPPNTTLTTTVLDWNSHAINPDPETISPPYDIVCGADVMYDISFASPLAHTISNLTNAKSVVFIAYERRDPLVHEEFMSKMKEVGFKGTKISKRAAGKLNQDSLVDIWKYKKTGTASQEADE
ncbi:hypothetical protein HDV00_003755 [Rhizophlyctis rosea]|nr:hypothetical protein HDV00_003755 [Rhizophlyctis rosea]